MKRTASLLCLLLFTFCCNAQITWEKLFVQSNTDVFRSVQEVPAGGYIAAGYTSHWSINDTDAYVVRLTVNGDTMWTRTFNGGRQDLFYKVNNTADGGFILCGYTSSYNALGDQDAYYMKLDANGNELWHFTYGFTNTKERAQDIIQTVDGGYAMVGYTNNGQPSYNAFLVKIDANGGQTWVKKYGGATTFDDANAIKELADGGFILAGQTSVPIWAGQIFLVRTNSIGDTCWTKSFGTDTSGKNENAEDIQITNNGFIICGASDSSGSDDGYLVKTDTGGVVQWTKKFGGSSPDDFHRVEKTTDGGYIITGTSQSNAVMISDQWLFKTDVNGDSTWARTFGGANHDHAYSGVQTSDGGYILCGYTASFGFNYEDALVIKVDGSGLLYNHLFYTTVTALVSPVNGTCGSANSAVTITVRNFGDTALSSFPDTVIITGAINQTLGQTFGGTIVPPNSANHTFTTTINTSAGGTFNFHCFTSNNNDVSPAMNSYDTTITLNGLPVPPTAIGDTSCGTGSVTLTATSPNTINWFSASTGGSSLAQGSSYTTTISNTTTFYVQASNACGTSTRTAVTAYVFPVTAAPLVFSAQRCGPGNVTLLASSGSPISWWDSATGGIMLQGNINSYVANVTTTTTFYVEAGTGSTCPSARVPVTATVNPLPDANFTPNASAVCLGDAFQFTNTTTGAVGYAWDFGDASGTSNQLNPSYTYAMTGTYMVRLIATSMLSCPDTIIIPVNVNTAPQISFSVPSTTGCAPFTVSFINSTINATDYLWSLGDGTATSISQNPTYTYNTPGTYTVSLNASVGSCSEADTNFNYITVIPSPTANFSTANVCFGNVMNFTNSSTGASSYSWDFGDANGTSTQTDPSYTYTSANTFTVSLVASDGTCTDTISQNVTAYAPPVIDLGPDITTNSVTYLLDAGAGFAGYAWDNGSTTQTITADTNGVYCVVVTDNNTCSNTDCIHVTLDAAGISYISGDHDLLIYPNPVSRFAVCNILFEGKTTGTLSVYDAVGNQVMKMDLFTSRQLPTVGLEAGVYFIEIKSGNKNVRRKLMIY
ncbi:MAG: PKD domain-containing protein [Bacteroidota bacterium]